jgi:hypothetical protein
MQVPKEIQEFKEIWETKGIRAFKAKMALRALKVTLALQPLPLCLLIQHLLIKS